MKKIVIFLLIFLVGLTSVSAEDYEIFDSTTEAYMSPNVDYFDSVKLLSFKYNSTEDVLYFEFSNSEGYPVNIKGYDVYNKRMVELELPSGVSKYGLESPGLKGSMFFVAFWNSNGFITLKESTVPLTLQDSLFLISHSALGYFTVKMFFYLLILMLISGYITKRIFIEKYLFESTKHVALPLLLMNVGLAGFILLAHYGTEFSNWDIRYLISYGKWIYFLALNFGVFITFRLFPLDTINIYSIGLQEFETDKQTKELVNTRELLTLPIFSKFGKTYIKYQGKVFEFKSPAVKPASLSFGDDYEDEPLYEVISYTIQDKFKSYNESTPFHRILSWIEKIKDKYSFKPGVFFLEPSKIMTADAVDAYHFTWSLGKVIHKNYELNYEVADLKRLRGDDVIAVSRVIVEIFTSAMEEFQQYSDYIIACIKRMKKGNNQFLDEVIERLESEGDEEDGEGGQTGDSDTTGESK